jgi:type VI secretion system secreted protein VgrG
MKTLRPQYQKPTSYKASGLSSRLRRLLPVIIAAAAIESQYCSAQDIGSADSFAALANQAITFAGAGNFVNGNLAVTPGTSITGSFTQNGTIYTGQDAPAVNAMDDATTAYNDIVAETPTTNMSSEELGGLTLTNGIYSFNEFAGGAADVSGTLTLSGPGNFVFQMDTTFTSGANANIVLENGAQATDVFWQIGSSATFGADSSLQGSFLAYTSITAGAGSEDSGSLVALGAALSFDGGNIITAVPEPSSYMLFSIGALVIGVAARRGVFFRNTPHCI